MSEPNSIFRTEALEFRARGRETPGGVLRLRPRWLRVFYWLLLALVLAGATLAVIVRAPASSSGPAVVDRRGGTFSALVPAAVAPELPGAGLAYVDLPGGRVRIKVLAARLVQSGISGGGLPAAAQPSILLSGRVTSRLAPRHGSGGAWRLAGQITVVLRGRALGGLLARQFDEMLGGGGGGG